MKSHQHGLTKQDQDEDNTNGRTNMDHGKLVGSQNFQETKEC